ncbi:MAG: ferritin-like domain-containing protein [Rhodospirillaceae bacterium]|nr:ferritin-like domain-containing protein [Rhodospirillaceae bacterium]
MNNPPTLCQAALDVLGQADPLEKVRLSINYANDWEGGIISIIGKEKSPLRPARPSKPELLSPSHMPRRSTGKNGRIALLHAIAHIELNAIDLAWDIILRFSSGSFSDETPKDFFNDWVGVAKDEARHFEMLVARLNDLGANYGDLPAHDGLWEAAIKSADDILARLALVPMILEARGLDTAPKTVVKLISGGDKKTAEIMQQITDDEISHVAAGVRWFEHICKIRGLDPMPHFHGLLKSRFRGDLKPPFAHDLRSKAGMDIGYYDQVS